LNGRAVALSRRRLYARNARDGDGAYGMALKAKIGDRAKAFLWRASVPFLIAALVSVPSASALADLPTQLSNKDRKLYSAIFSAIEKGNWKRASVLKRRATAPLPDKILTWLAMSRSRGDFSFREIDLFLTNNPDWPRQKSLRRRAESLMAGEKLPATHRIAWFDRFPPVTTTGRVLQAEAILETGSRKRAHELLRRIWRTSSFTARDQRRFLKRHSKLLNRGDHWARLDWLLWRGMRSQARRVLHYVSKDRRLEAEARIRLRAFRGGVDAAITRLPAAMRGEPGFVFERLRWRRKKNRTDDALAILKNPPGNLGRPELWAKERMIIARRLLAKGRPDDAWDAVADHRIDPALDRAAYAEIEWLAGWIALRFLDKPGEAYARFRDLFDAVRYPVSKSRAAYWIARAALRTGDREESNQWFAKAAIHWTTYHEQLAAYELPPRMRPLFKGSDPLPTRAETDAFRKTELARAVILLDQIGQHRLVLRFLLHIARPGASPETLVQAFYLARALGRRDMGVWISRRALRDGNVLLKDGYPHVPMPRDGVEPALLRSLARQESNFDPKARSRSGALGVMQLMPATARETARRIGLRYSKSKLTKDPAYNIRIGRAYITGMLERFNGSYILAIAAYNAGPHAVERWLRKNGDPRGGGIDPIDWIELIPYSETRTYVQRVLGNLQVFRYRETGGKIAVTLETDLKR